MSKKEFINHLRRIWRIQTGCGPDEMDVQDYIAGVRQCLSCGQSMEEIIISYYSAMVESMAEELMEAMEK